MVPNHRRDDYSMTLGEAAAYIGARTGRRPAANNLYRWIRKGARGAKLEAMAIGGRLYTSRQAVDAFLEAGSHLPPMPKREPVEGSVPAPGGGLHSTRQAMEASRHAADHAAAVRYLSQQLGTFSLLMNCC
jgi:hypothetical protein